MKGKQILSINQLFAIFFISLLDHRLISFSRWITKISKQDAWISTLIGGVLAIIGINVILFLFKRFPDKTFVQISEDILGKYLGKIPSFMVFSFFIFETAISIRFMANLITTWLLPRTPLEVIIISILVLQIYVIRNGLKVLGRFLEVIFLIIIPVLPLTLVPFFMRKNFLRLLPVGGSGIVSIIKGSLPSFYTLLAIFSILILYPYIRKEATHQEVVKTCNVSLSLAVLLKTFLVFSIIAVFGVRELRFFLYPMLEYVKILRFPIIERVEFIMIFYWIFLIFSAISIFYFTANLILEQMAKIEGFKNTSLFLAIPIYYLTKLPANVGELFKYVQLEGLVFTITVLTAIVIVFGVALILRKGARE